MKGECSILSWMMIILPIALVLLIGLGIVIGKAGGVSSIIGFIMLLLGISMIFIGNDQNNDMERKISSLFESGKTNPGDLVLYSGMILVVIGVVLFIVGFVLKSQKKRMYNMPNLSPNQMNSNTPNIKNNYASDTNTSQNPIQNYWTCFNCRRKNPDSIIYCQCGMSQMESYKRNVQYKSKDEMNGTTNPYTRRTVNSNVGKIE